MAEPTYRRARELLEADLGDELLALDQQGGSCFAFNSVATDVWRRLAAPATFDELRAGLMADYDVDGDTCDADLTALLSELEAAGLIARAPAA